MFSDSTEVANLAGTQEVVDLVDSDNDDSGSNNCHVHHNYSNEFTSLFTNISGLDQITAHAILDQAWGKGIYDKQAVINA